MVTEILKGNGLITKFMGVKKIHAPELEVEFQLVEMSDGNIWHWEEMQYHSDWNWLMPVVEKICEIDNCADEWLAARLEKADLEIFKTSVLCHKQAVYERVIQFITWYNNQK